MHAHRPDHRAGPAPDGPLTDRQDTFEVVRELSSPVWVFDIDHNRVICANAAACTMWQAEDEAELCARDMSLGMSTTVARRLRQYQDDFLRQPGITFREMWTLYPHGKPVSSNVAFRGFRLPDNRMAMLCEILSGTGDTPDNLRSTEALLHTDVMIAHFDLRGTALYMNPAARNVIGCAAENLGSLFTDKADYHAMMFDLDGRGEHRMVAQVALSPDPMWFDLSAKLCSDAVTGEPAVLVTAIDVTELKTARDTARYLADRDQLTGCYNRFYMQRHFDALQADGQTGHVMLYFDVDRFKHVNDTFGHEAGDAVLKTLAKRALSAVRDGDIVGRLGGDEFVVLLTCPAEDKMALQRAEQVFEKLAGPLVRGSASIPVHVSMGCARFAPGKDDFEAVMRQADIALYHSKREGRNRLTFFDTDMGRAALAKIRLESEIEQALQNEEFVLHFQPRVDVKSGAVVSVEGLVRWNHPERGLVPPDEFIPVCEETGLIETLGQHVLEIGFRQARAWHDAGRSIDMSLNISPRQFSDKQLMQTLSRFAATRDFPSHRIELEITENILIGDVGAIASKLKAISEMGYRIAIDDFGTGYSNLAYISQFPLSGLKIDQSFIRQLPETGPIVSLILALGQQVGATVVAEGVETREQFDWLSYHNCDQIQGFYFSRPVSLENLDDHWLADRPTPRTGSPP
ncbi:bifunctional diguanylate cyclase/phosphodiesterase [uncultured Roseobacter sp.]|uniref:putative bifunctional diguanylate cyclase/phosphodiesterase n=1 Tax=uncultured Roseobacter sp. TaxID=114847 RepID=UPI00263A13E5|nr:bifunctional diguanylate cyclase/phosphodiesterase [uncultured Roseobacter sp.]